jgi:hypothetical protein
MPKEHLRGTVKCFSSPPRFGVIKEYILHLPIFKKVEL